MPRPRPPLPQRESGLWHSPPACLHSGGGVGRSADSGYPGRSFGPVPMGPDLPRTGGGSGHVLASSCPDTIEPDRSFPRSGRSIRLGKADAALEGQSGPRDVSRLPGLSFSGYPPGVCPSRERLQPSMGHLHPRGDDPGLIPAGRATPLPDPLRLRTGADRPGPSARGRGIRALFCVE